MSLSKIKALKERQGAIRDEMTAIVDKATDGVLNAEETAAFDAKEAEFKNIGESIKRMESMPEVQDLTPGRDLAPGANLADRPLVDRVIVPASAKFRHTGLRAYKGPNADKEAFIAGQFVAATVLGVSASQQWCRDHGIRISNAMSGGTTTAGGYLTPVEMEAAIIALREQYGVARQNARIVPMGSDTKDVPVRDSGLTTYWPGEGVAITASDMVFSNAQLVAKKLCALAVYSSELSEDSIIDLGDLVTQEVAQGFALAEDLAFFIGDGTSTYGGITGITSALDDGSTIGAATGNDSFEDLDLVDFEKVVGTAPNYPGAVYKWYISKPGYAASMLRLMDAAGGNTNASLSAGVTPQFLGYDVVFTQVLNSTLGTDASTTKCLFADLKLGALIGNRRGITIAQSTEYKFAEDQLAIKGTERVAMKIHSVGQSTTAGGDPGAILQLQSAA